MNNQSPSLGFWLMMLLLVGTLAILLLVQGCSSTQGVYLFANNLTEARALAEQHNRYIFMQVGSHDCAPCRKMEVETLHEKGRAKISSEFVYFGAQYEDHAALLDEMGVVSTPVSMILDKNGNVVARRDGYLSPQGFNAWLRGF